MAGSRSGSDSELGLELLHHVRRHRRQIEAGIPVPLGAGAAVVERVGPGVGDRLAHGVDIVVDLEGGDVATKRGAGARED